MRCRGCDQPVNLDNVVCDLGTMPLVNRLLTREQLQEPETRWPLRAVVCEHCLLVQLERTPAPGALFTDEYPFFSGQAATWGAHCRDFADMAAKRFRLGATSRVLEIGSNDGTMLRRFRGLGIPAIGVEPCGGVAQHALMEGLPTIVDWWGTGTASRLRRTPGVPTGKSWRADLVIANNVLAHVPDLHDFLKGVELILAPNGTAVFEVAYVGSTIRDRQWDQIYHEHHCYFSLRSLQAALSRAGLSMVHAEHLPTHGGSIRVYAQRAEDPRLTANVSAQLQQEEDAGLHRLETYTAFAAEPANTRAGAHRLLAEYAGKRIVGYGASAKAAVTLNYLGVGPETIEFIADTTLSKQGRYLPGCRIPIKHPLALEQAQPDVVVLLAWNWAAEAVPKIRKACPSATVMYLRDTEPQGAEFAEAA